MKNTLSHLSLNRRQAVGTAARRNSITTVESRLVRTIVLPAKVSCAGHRTAVDFAPPPDLKTTAVMDHCRNSRKVMPCPRLPWRSAVLNGAENGLLLERMLYFVLATTSVASLLMAFWQLRSLEAGWASFVELVGRIVS